MSCQTVKYAQLATAGAGVTPLAAVTTAAASAGIQNARLMLPLDALPGASVPAQSVRCSAAWMPRPTLAGTPGTDSIVPARVHELVGGAEPLHQQPPPRRADAGEAVEDRADGWGHLTAIIDCHDREVTGYEFAMRGRAKEAERALEEACLARFGTLRPDGATPVVRSDNGLIFQSRRFRAACRDYRLRQEFITPYTPEQNGLVERFFRSLKEECVWLHNFSSFTEARAAITKWIQWYNAERPHQALGYRSPRQFRALQPKLVA